jgi:3-oxoacyl-[acyl-carrier-protein] synthase III
MLGYKTKILGTGIYLPKKIITNFDLEKILDTTDKWITERTGIKERRKCSREGGEWPSDMALMATKEALIEANLEPNDIDLILLNAVNPDYVLPCTSSILQNKLGITNNCPCLDMSPACSGFVYGMHIAESFISNGTYKNILVVGSEFLTSQTDWKDRSSAILFGDGCGVFILGRTPEGEKSQILSSVLHTDGKGGDLFYQHNGRAVHPLTTENIQEGDYFMKMKGSEMFKVATRTLCQNAFEVLKMANLSLNDIDWVVPHQANLRIIEKTCELIGVPMEKTIVNIQKYGNTSTATIPIAFYEAVRDGRIKRGDIVLFDTFGAGLTSGAIVFKY